MTFILLLLTSDKTVMLCCSATPVNFSATKSFINLVRLTCALTIQPCQTITCAKTIQAKHNDLTASCSFRAVLLNLFMAPRKPDQADKFEHIAAILTNVTRLKLGRSLLLEPGRGFIQALVAQLESPNLLRRQGCAAAFRNCCFSAEVCNCPGHALYQSINQLYC